MKNNLKNINILKLNSQKESNPLQYVGSNVLLHRYILILIKHFSRKLPLQNPNVCLF